LIEVNKQNDRFINILNQKIPLKNNYIQKFSKIEVRAIEEVNRLFIARHTASLKNVQI
jgi:hypothetical protein